ncbi:hypothetical protein JCM6882_008686 [Rhodosporidiobolus microsporus]
MSCSRMLPSLLSSTPLASSSRTRIASTALPLLPRLFSTSPSPAAAAPGRSAYDRPKRDQTTYGVGRAGRVPRRQWPKQADTNTDSHPLWRFFHDQQSLEVPDKRLDNSSRSWTSLELRRKSFEELHQLWYVLLRERNVLLTQREEARRLRVDLGGFGAVPDKLRLCQKSMARIKQVLSERRHAALHAAEILRAEGQADAALQLEGEAGKLGAAAAE